MVNEAAAVRQALGSGFTEAPDDDVKTEELKSRHLVLTPHKRWLLPESPSWSENPFSDNNWQFQYHMLRWLDPLRRASLRGDVEAARLRKKYASSWVAANPVGKGACRWSWIDMSDGIRAMELSHGIAVCGEEQWLLNSLQDHAGWLKDPGHLAHGNHALHQHIGLFVLGCVLDDTELVDLAVSRLRSHLFASYDDRGVNEEGAMSYQLMNYRWWQEAVVRLQREGIETKDITDRLDQAPTFLAHATTPLGKFARIGDTDGGNARTLRHEHTDYVTTGGRSGSHPEDLHLFSAQGFGFMRSGWGEERDFARESFVSVTWGNQKKIHGHADGGSVTYCALGVQWIDGPGRYYYGNDPVRRYVVSREANSVVRVEAVKVDPNHAPVTCRRAEVAGGAQVVELDDPSYENTKVSRTVLYFAAADQLLVLDRIKSGTGVKHGQVWNLNPAVQASGNREGFRLSAGDQVCMVRNLLPVDARSTHRGEKNPLRGWYSTGWRRCSPTTQLEFTTSGPGTYATLIGPDNEVFYDIARQLALRGCDPDEYISSLDGIGDGSAVLNQSNEHMDGETETRCTVHHDGRGLFKISLTEIDGHCAFYVIEDAEIVARQPYQRRTSAYFSVQNPEQTRVRVYLKGSAGDSRSFTVSLMPQDSSGEN